MKEVKILHQISGRDADIETRDDIMRGLTNGKYYLAGTIQVQGDVNYDNEAGLANWNEVLENAWMASQNDAHPNPVIGMESGNPVYGPAEWNGEIAQRSSMMGDLFVVDGQIYRAEGVGFKRIVGYSLLDRKRGIVLGANPWVHDDDRINKEFDELLTD